MQRRYDLPVSGEVDGEGGTVLRVPHVWQSKPVLPLCLRLCREIAEQRWGQYCLGHLAFGRSLFVNKMGGKKWTLVWKICVQ
jgi:hypothetical protein